MSVDVVEGFLFHIDGFDGFGLDLLHHFDGVLYACFD